MSKLILIGLQHIILTKMEFVIEGHDLAYGKCFKTLYIAYFLTRVCWRLFSNCTNESLRKMNDVFFQHISLI